MGKGNLQDKFINKEKYDKYNKLSKKTRWSPTTIEKKKNED